MRRLNLRIKFFMFAVLFFSVNIIMAQTIDTTGISDPIFPDGPTLLGMVKIYHLLYGALVIIWGYVAKFFNLGSTPNKLILTIVAGGTVLVGVFVMFGFSPVLPLIISFLSAIGIYNLIFKPFGLRVMRPEERKAAINRKNMQR